MSFFSYLLFKCLILSSVWYGSHHYSYSMGFFPPIFYPLRIVLSFPISSSVCPRCYLSSCLLSSLSLGAPERSLYISTHCLHVAYWCTRARESACMADVRRCLLCVRHRQIGRGNAMLHVLLALCKCMQEREGGGGKLSWWRRVSREGGSVWHSTHNAAQRQRERLKLLVVR